MIGSATGAPAATKIALATTPRETKPSTRAGLRRLYVSTESGFITVFSETAHGLRKLGEDFLATEAHTVSIDPETHLVYFPLQGPNGKPHLLVMRPV